MRKFILTAMLLLSSQRTYDHAIREFIEWYCSEPRLAFNKTVVARYRISLEQQHYASTTINLRLAAVRRLAYEAADCGLLSVDLAAGIRRVKGAKRLGMPVGNWLSAEQGKHLLRTVDLQSSRQTRLRDARHSLGLRFAARRTDGVESRRHPATGRALGHCRSRWEGRPYTHHPGSRMG
jgi:site-specific recombinase XerD